MIDPITIGLAFTAAQQSVSYIKKAIALGKDVNSLYGQFAKFFENSDKIHGANVAAQTNKKILTDGQIRAMSIEIAMQSKALRDAEKQLKELLIYSGNSDVWDQMMAERVRMYKDRAKLEADIKNARIQAQSDMVDRLLIGISFMAIAVPTVMFSFAMLVRS
jgi:ABC-type phosphate transport system auxiliary subunit